MTGPTHRRQLARRFAPIRVYELPLLIALVLTWMALWRSFSLLAIMSGVIVSIITMRFFSLPPVELGGRFNIWWASRYFTYFIWHVMIASFTVAWLAIRPGQKPRTSLLEIQLKTHSDFIMTMVSLTISLIPGSLVVETDRLASKIYLHVLDTPDERAIERARAQVERIEMMLVRTIGTVDELEAVQQ